MVCRRWTWERDVLSALGVKNPDRVDDELGLGDKAPPRVVAPVAGSRRAVELAQRRAQVQAMGGELG